MSPARKRARTEERRVGDERSGRPRRSADRRAQWIERISAVIAAGCFAAGWISLQHQADDIASSRVDGTRQRCDLVEHIVKALDQAKAPATYAPDLRNDLVVCRETLKKYQEAQR